MIISVSNQKGGVGKTDLSVNLSTYLAKEGKNILLVDLDPQANATDYLVKGLHEVGTYDLLIAEDPLEDVVVKTGINNLDLVPSSQKLSSARNQLFNEVDMQFKLKGKLAGHKYDYVIIDTPPSLDILTINSLVAARGVVIPIQTNYFAMDGVNKLLQTINSVKRGLNPSLDITGVVLTMFDKRNNLSKEVQEEVKKSFKNKVFKTAIPINVKLAESPSHHKPISLYASWSRGAKAYEMLAKEFLEKTRR